MGGGKYSTPNFNASKDGVPLPSVPTREDAEASLARAEAEAKEKERERKRQEAIAASGRASTVLAGEDEKTDKNTSLGK